MAKFNIRTAILISIFLGVILLFVFNFDQIILLILIGFIATYLTIPKRRTYKIGGIIGGAFGIMFFIYNFLTPPPLTYNFSGISLLNIVIFTLSGILNLFVEFIFFIIICATLGSIGGLLVEKLLKKRQIEPKRLRRRSLNKTR